MTQVTAKKKPITPANSNVRSLIPEKVDHERVKKSAALLHQIHPFPKDPATVKTKEVLAQLLIEWTSKHGNEKEIVDCETCKGAMDVSLFDKGLEQVCIFCGDGGEVLPPLEQSSPVAVTKPVIEEDDEDDSDEDEDNEDEDTKVEAPKMKKKTSKVTTSKAKVATVTPIRKNEIVAAAAVVDDAKISPEAKDFVEEIDTIRLNLQNATQSVHSEMWATGRFFARVLEKKLWAIHPGRFPSFEAFVAGVFGSLCAPRAAMNMVEYFKANPKSGPVLDGKKNPYLLPPIKFAKKGKPEALKRREEVATPKRLDDGDTITVVAKLKRTQRIPLLMKATKGTLKGKDTAPAKKIGDKAFWIEQYENDLIITCRLTQNAKGELVIDRKVERKAAEK
jgi:hypothetical protein